MSEMNSTSTASEGAASVTVTESSPQSSTQSASIEATQQGEVGQSSEPQAQVQPAYTPNYKFKFPKLGTNEQEEKEFDEWIRPAINKDNEAKVRDLYTKAHGMDFYKEKYNKTNEKYRAVEPLVKTWHELSEVYNQGDLDSFFKGLKIPEEKLYQFVLDKLNEREMSHEQKLERQQQMELRRKATYLERENQSLQERYQSEITQAREFQLGQTLSKPEVSSIAKSFDERMGRQGAFREEVIKRGVIAFTATGQDISPEQAVQEVISLLGVSSQAQSQGQQATQAQQQAAKSPPPVIPNVGARSASPAKKTPRSLADLKKLADSM